MQPSRPLSASEIQQKQLARHCYWDQDDQVLWVDCRKIMPKLGVVRVPSWDSLMMSAEPVPNYPSQLQVLSWSNFSDIAIWRKQIPKWVQESCALFPSHQLKLLHYAGKYPQVVELLDHSPMLAWRLIKSPLEEPEIVALLAGKRQDMVAQVGWPGKEETVRFLRNLRLRFVNEMIAEQIETCLLDDNRLQALQNLPRINSMALSLAARFPHLIGSRLHQTLAQLPCRPMQCQSMVALLEDAYALAEWLALPQVEIEKIGQCRYLVEVTKLYQAWMQLGRIRYAEQQGVDLTALPEMASFQAQLSKEPQILNQPSDWLLLSELQQHAWWVSAEQADTQLVAWQDEEGTWASLIGVKAEEKSTGILRLRGLDNCLAGAKQQSDMHLWLAKLD